MKRLYYLILVSLSLLPLVAYRQDMSVSNGTPFYTHFVYMFAHANIFHWMCNTWSMMLLVNVVRWYRVVAAYILAVIISFIGFIVSSTPVLGASTIVAFFVGYVAQYYWSHNRTAFFCNLAAIILTLFIPQFAGACHLAMFGCGVIFWFVERAVSKLIKEVRNE